MNDNHQSADGRDGDNGSRGLPLGEAWSMDAFLETVEKLKETADAIAKDAGAPDPASRGPEQKSLVGLGQGFSVSPAGKVANVGLRIDSTETTDLSDPWEFVPNPFGDGVDYFRGAVLVEHVVSDRQDPMSAECYTLHDVMRAVDQCLTSGRVQPIHSMRRALPNITHRFDEHVLAHLAHRHNVLEKERRALRAEQRRLTETSQRAGIQARQRRREISDLVELERKLAVPVEETYFPPKPKPGNARSMMVFDKWVDVVGDGMKTIEKVFVLRRPGAEGKFGPRPDFEYMIVAGPVVDWGARKGTYGVSGDWEWLLRQLREGETEESFRAVMSSMVEF